MVFQKTLTIILRLYFQVGGHLGSVHRDCSIHTQRAYVGLLIKIFHVFNLQHSSFCPSADAKTMANYLVHVTPWHCMLLNVYTAISMVRPRQHSGRVLYQGILTEGDGLLQLTSLYQIV
jgi:hypothetical protein